MAAGSSYVPAGQWLLLLLLALAATTTTTITMQGNDVEEVPKMILILLDGFRWDYVDIHGKEGLPGFEYMAKEGTRAKFLNPVFPSGSSFPNWHAIVTGLYAESHGIVGNCIYDRENQWDFSLGYSTTTSRHHWWNASEPLWITSTKNGLDTALFHWSSCNVACEDDVCPRLCIPYARMPPSARNLARHLEQALDMIDHMGYDLAMVYEGLVDTQGHDYGPLSVEVTAAVRDVDLALQSFWANLRAQDLINRTNVVVLSDHGMTESQPLEMEHLDVAQCLDPVTVANIVEFVSYINIQPKPGHTMQVVEALRDCPETRGKVEVYRKSELDDVFHYKAHPRVLEVIVIAKPGYLLKPPGARMSAVPQTAQMHVGAHGFGAANGHSQDMRGILYATGPSFDKGVVVEPMEQVDVYGVLCSVLRLPCHSNNSSANRIESFLASSSSSSTTLLRSREAVSVALVSFSACLAVLLFFAISFFAK
ncbi:glycerophosphocholine cholinephosphodiesterase ENPP6-like [Oratosquilla oratoria]|uniref:glycerophosphocholine cholinephosphodiesterase ENPP6-like n=1 Tax=Oratosquilla oratoria TaxID=337810 RepID=UPI003F76CD2D